MPAGSGVIVALLTKLGISTGLARVLAIGAVVLAAIGVCVGGYLYVSNLHEQIRTEKALASAARAEAAVAKASASELLRQVREQTEKLETLNRRNIENQLQWGTLLATTNDIKETPNAPDQSTVDALNSSLDAANGMLERASKILGPAAVSGGGKGAKN